MCVYVYIYIYLSTYLSISTYLYILFYFISPSLPLSPSLSPPVSNPNTSSIASLGGGGAFRILAFTRSCFASKLYCGNPSSVYPPLPTCKAYPIAILLHDCWAIDALLPTPLLFAIHHTVLVMAISCKGQVEARSASRIRISRLRNKRCPELT